MVATQRGGQEEQRVLLRCCHSTGVAVAKRRQTASSAVSSRIFAAFMTWDWKERVGGVGDHEGQAPEQIHVCPFTCLAIELTAWVDASRKLIAGLLWSCCTASQGGETRLTSPQ